MADADAWYAAHVPADAVLTHSGIDSSRNGHGPWTPPSGAYAQGPAQQTWRNLPCRGGLGARPTADTRTPLLDAHLWIRCPAGPTEAAPAAPPGRPTPSTASSTRPPERGGPRTP